MRQEDNVSRAPSIAIDAMTWRPVGDDCNEGGDPRSRLASTIVLGGIYFHVDAIEVQGGCFSDDKLDLQRPVDSAHDAMYDDWANAAGGDGPFETVEIEGREYAIFASPFTQ